MTIERDEMRDSPGGSGRSGYTRVVSLWPDGSIISGEGWQELEDTLRARQWHHYNRNAFRREMRRRAELWSGAKIPVSSAEAMLRGLEQAGMCRLEVEGE